MPKVKKFGCGRRKFYGNRFTKKNEVCETVVNTNTVENVGLGLQVPHGSASTLKLTHVQEETDTSFHVITDNIKINSGNVIINLNSLTNLLKKCVKCKSCGNDDCIQVYENTLGRKGLSSQLVIACDMCNVETSGYTSEVNKHKTYSNNIRLAYAMRCIGKGQAACETFCAVMDLPPPPRLDRYNNVIENSLNVVANMSMKTAVQESVEVSGDENIAAAFDGSWQKRGHTSLNGVVTATSLENGKVIDVECVTKYCHGCKVGLTEENHDCSINFEGYSGGMESKGILNMFSRSVERYGVKYTQYLGDGDSKGFLKVLEAKPYGDDVSIEKLECVGHVQKRMGSRLRKLKKDQQGKKLSDGKCISGRGRLTDAEIDLLQKYYGLAIRRNVGNLEAMCKAVWATFFHKASTDRKPAHNFCPEGSDSWCGYQRAKVSGTEYKHKHSLPMPVMLAMKSIFYDLSNVKLLEKCLHGRTQNPNESFNRCIWDRVPKTTFVGLQTLKMGVLDAVICFNEGTVSRCKVLQELTISPGENMSNGLLTIDRRRVSLGEKVSLQNSKEQRTKKRNLKRQQEDKEMQSQDEYGAGMF